MDRPRWADQRPSVIKLADGNLVMVGDARVIHTPNTAPYGWVRGDAPYVALSTDGGTSWTIKALPVALKHETRAQKALGYATVRQAPNGVIHVLATMTHPVCTTSSTRLGSPIRPRVTLRRRSPAARSIPPLRDYANPCGVQSLLCRPPIKNPPAMPTGF